MFRLLRTLTLLCSSFALPACEIISGPGDYDVPDEDQSLDPARLSVGYEIYYCGDWNRTFGKPSDGALFVDVFFYAGFDQARLDHPLEVHRRIVESVRASIVRSYRAAGFRVWIHRDSIPALYGHNGVTIRSVPDPRRYDLQVTAFYGGPGVFNGVDSVSVSKLGGRIVRNYEALGILLMHLPERSLPEIREDPRVQWIDQGPDFLCPR